MMTKTKKKELIAKTLYQFMFKEFDKEQLDKNWKWLQQEYTTIPGKDVFYRMANGILKKIEPLIINEYLESVANHPSAPEETYHGNVL